MFPFFVTDSSSFRPQYRPHVPDTTKRLRSSRGGSYITRHDPSPSPKGDSQPDLFAARSADIPIRDQRDTMERPFFSLAKKLRFATIEYHLGDTWVEVSANPQFGMATIRDAVIRL